MLKLQRTLAQLLVRQLLGNMTRSAQMIGMAPLKKEEVLPNLRLLAWSCTVLGLHASLAQLNTTLGLSGVAEQLTCEHPEETDAFRLLSQVSECMTQEDKQLDGLAYRAVALGAALDSSKLLRQADARGAVRKFTASYSSFGETLGRQLKAKEWDAMQTALFTFELAARRLGANQAATTAAAMEQAVSSEEPRGRGDATWLLTRLDEALTILFEQLEQITAREWGTHSPSAAACP